MRSIAVIGASVAGVYAAKALRAQGYDGELHLVSAENASPYDRPPLSKGYLLGQQTEKEILLAPDGYYAEQRIRLHLGVRATAVRAGHAELSDGSRLSFDRALIATGSRPRRLEVPGGDLGGVLYLRTLQDARNLRRRLAGAEKIIIVGGGFIGLEAAAAARQLGKDALVLEALSAPLVHTVGEDASAALTALHSDHGVRILTGARVVAFEGDAEVRAVRLDDGRRFPCDLTVVGVGVQPNAELLASGADGIAVDERLETAQAGIYAAGDAARFSYRGRSVRIEHWDVARTMGEHAARTMLGSQDAFAASPFFWSDQYDTTYQYFGHGDAGDAVVLRGAPEQQDFIAFYLREGAIAAAFSAGRPRDALALRRLVDQAARVDAALLRSEDVSLKRLSRR